MLGTENVQMLQGLVLLKVVEPRCRVESQQVVDEEKSKGKNPKKDVMIMKSVDTEVWYNVQQAVIVSIAAGNPIGVSAGDVVLIDYRRTKEFDLFADVLMCSTYDILAKVV